MDNEVMYTSRSAVEAYQLCRRYRWNQNFLGGIGIVGKQRSVPLVTGSAVHKGIECLLGNVRVGGEGNLENAVNEAVSQYVADVEEAGFSGKNLQTNKQQWFTFCEQKALSEALIRAWYYKELPRIKERYKVIAVEREIAPIKIAEDVYFQARVDAEFQEILSGDYHNYSVKTTSMWNDNTEASYKSDLQGVTEIWAVEEDYRRVLENWDKAIAISKEIMDNPKFPDKNIVSIWNYLVTKRPADGKKVMGVRFCILLKGQRKVPEYHSNDPEAVKITYSPLIRGYKYFTPGSIKYAHSWFYPNPENKSGKSIIGKGWEPFNVWESDISIKQWIEMLNSGEIQPECGDVLKDQIITPVEYFRDDKDIEIGMLEVSHQETLVRQMAQAMHADSSDYNYAAYFPHNRKHCNFHFGGACEYKEYCWKPEVNVDPLGSGLYQIRVPHHEAERNVWCNKWK